MPESAVIPADKFDSWVAYVDAAIKEAEKLEKSSSIGFETYKHMIEEMKSFLKHTHKNGDVHAVAVGNACPDISVLNAADLKTYTFRFKELVKDLKSRTKTFDLKNFDPKELF